MVGSDLGCSVQCFLFEGCAKGWEPGVNDLSTEAALFFGPAGNTPSPSYGLLSSLYLDNLIRLQYGHRLMDFRQ